MRLISIQAGRTTRKKQHPSLEAVLKLLVSLKRERADRGQGV